MKLLAIFFVALLNALVCGKRPPRRWPHLAFKDKPFTKKRLTAIHKIVNEWPDDDTTFVYNETLPDWQQPVEVTPELYAELANGGIKVPWLIVFVRTKRSQPQFYHSDFVMNTMKVLSDDYFGRVRFGYVDVLDDELLKETFEIYAVPQNFYCVPNLYGRADCHEMHAMSLGYKPIREFIEGGYKDKENVYQTFEIPHRIG